MNPPVGGPDLVPDNLMVIHGVNSNEIKYFMASPFGVYKSTAYFTKNFII